MLNQIRLLANQREVAVSILYKMFLKDKINEELKINKVMKTIEINIPDEVLGFLGSASNEQEKFVLKAIEEKNKPRKKTKFESSFSRRLSSDI